MSALRKTSIEKTGVHLMWNNPGEFNNLSKEQTNDLAEFKRDNRSSNASKKKKKIKCIVKLGF